MVEVCSLEVAGLEVCYHRGRPLVRNHRSSPNTYEEMAASWIFHCMNSDPFVVQSQKMHHRLVKRLADMNGSANCEHLQTGPNSQTWKFSLQKPCCDRESALDLLLKMVRHCLSDLWLSLGPREAEYSLLGEWEQGGHNSCMLTAPALHQVLEWMGQIHVLRMAPACFDCVQMEPHLGYYCMRCQEGSCVECFERSDCTAVPPLLWAASSSATP